MVIYGDTNMKIKITSIPNKFGWGGQVGTLNTHGGDFPMPGNFISINSGGSHESNPNEGVPFGYDQNGIPNLVEEGETVFNDYVFSKRLRVPKSLRKKYKLGGDLSYAEASKKLAKESEERPNDPISTRGLEYFMQDLAMSQEATRTERNNKKFSKGGNLFWDGGDAEQQGTPFYFPFGTLYNNPGWVVSQAVTTGNNDTSTKTATKQTSTKPKTTYSESNKPRLQVIDPEKVRRQARQQARLKVVNTERRLKGDPPLTLTRPDDPSMSQYNVSGYTLPTFLPQRPLRSPDLIDYNALLSPPSGFEYQGYSTYGTNTSAQKTNSNSNSGSATISDDNNGAQGIDPTVYTDTYSSGNKKAKTKTTYSASSIGNSGSSGSSYKGTKSNTESKTDNSQTSAVSSITDEHKVMDSKTPETSKVKPKSKYFYRDANGTNPTEVTGNDPVTEIMNKGRYTLGYRSQNDDGSYNYYYDPVKETPPVEPRPTWMRYTPAAALGITSLTDALGLTNKPDYTNADAIAEMYKGTGLYRPVSFSPLGNYLTYRPFDRDYYLNKMSSEAGATRRNLLNTSGGNRATAMAGLLAADNNYLGKMGELARQAEEFNMQQKQAIADFNRETDSINASGMFQADSANQKAFMEAMSQYLKGMETAAAMREKARLTADAAKSANLSNFITSIGDIGRENMAWNWRDFYKATSAPIATELDPLLGGGTQTTASTTSKKDDTISKAKGGKIKRRKGLTY